MNSHSKANASYLEDFENSERNVLEYGIQAIRWLHHVCRFEASRPWVKHVDEDFIAAMEAIIRFCETDADQRQVAKALVISLASWRAEIEGDNPLVAFADYLDQCEAGEACGGFDITLNDILEGLTAEYVSDDWDFASSDRCLALVALVTVALSDIATTVFWAARSGGQNLDVELRRLFSKKDNHGAFVGQMANLAVAGHAATWGLAVEFLGEMGNPTPDFVVRTPRGQLLVECTSSKASCERPDREDKAGDAIHTGWDAKVGKFERTTSPGIICVDHSGLFLDNEVGTPVRTELIKHVTLSFPSSVSRTVRTYPYKHDKELQARQNEAGGFLWLLSLLLNSETARKRHIHGILALQAQQVTYKAIGHRIERPKSSYLAWCGDGDCEAFRLALALHQPGIADKATNPVLVIPPTVYFV